MTEASISSHSLLEEIDAQQDDLLDQLDALNARIEQVLKVNSASFGVVTGPNADAAARSG
jgi:hypothetical protein